MNKFKDDAISLIMRLHGLAEFTDNDARRQELRDPQLSAELRKHSEATRALMAYIENRCEIERSTDGLAVCWRVKR